MYFYTFTSSTVLALTLLASLYVDKVGSKNGRIANSLCVLRENLGCVLGVPASVFKDEQMFSRMSKCDWTFLLTWGVTCFVENET